MNKLLNKWYFGLITIPFIINLLTSVIDLPDLFKEWEITVIIALLFLVVILITELTILKKRFKYFEFKPKESDKRIVANLLNILDINMFHEDIKEQDSWYGYKKEAIRKTISFVQEARLISNITADDVLNQLLLELSNTIDDFNSYTSTYLYGRDSDIWYLPAKDTDFNIKKTEKARPVMNTKADKAFEKLTIFLNYLKHKNYLE